MPDTATPKNLTPQSLPSRAVIIIAVAVGFALAATLTLWAHFGSAVFYEMILAGVAACF